MFLVIFTENWDSLIGLVLFSVPYHAYLNSGLWVFFKVPLSTFSSLFKFKIELDFFNNINSCLVMLLILMHFWTKEKTSMIRCLLENLTIVSRSILKKMKRAYKTIMF